ncbi:TPA: hypothetical protein SK282_004366 [Yersinia enterocolitica]|nr:hypothetical protein [Yersinia enterocolitica]
MLFLFSWTLDGKGGNKKEPTWDDIENQLNRLRDASGTLTLDVISDAEIGPEMLQVRTEHCYFIVMLGETTDDDYEVRSYWDMTQPDNKVEILGDYWPERQLTKDFDLVVRIFREFFDTGNVSTDLLN